MRATTAAPGASSSSPAGSWPSMDDRPPRFQAGLVTLGTLALVPAAVFAVLRVVPPTDDATALLASFISSGAVFALVGLGCLGVALLRARRRGALAVLTTLAAVLLAGHVAVQAPLFVPDDRPATGPGFTLLSLNTYKGEADPDQVVAAAAAADVVVLVELTDDALTALDARGWRDRFPYAAGVYATTVSNTAVFSRFPLDDSVQFGRGSFDQWVTQVAVPDAGPVRLFGVHPCNPYCGGGRWTEEHTTLRRAVEAGPDLPTVLAGDFNAVDDHAPMLALHRAGLRSATDLLGAGWLPTYPANRAVPPLLAIDHVLVDDRLTVTALRRVPVTGTDHLGLLATVAPAG